MTTLSTAGTERQAERQTGREAERQRDREAKRQRDRETTSSTGCTRQNNGERRIPWPSAYTSSSRMLSTCGRPAGTVRDKHSKRERERERERERAGGRGTRSLQRLLPSLSLCLLLSSPPLFPPSLSPGAAALIAASVRLAGREDVAGRAGGGGAAHHRGALSLANAAPQRAQWKDKGVSFESVRCSC